MRKAAETEYSLAEDHGDVVRDCDLSLDGTYMTRGHTSNIGTTTGVGLETGKVLDVGTKSKICKSCEYWEKQDPNSDKFRRWQARHAGKCKNNHQGSSGGMEGEIAKDIFCRSVEKYNLRYVNFIGDGDTNSFKKTFEARPYGDLDIKKIECVGHVQKKNGQEVARPEEKC